MPIKKVTAPRNLHGRVIMLILINLSFIALTTSIYYNTDFGYFRSTSSAYAQENEFVDLIIVLNTDNGKNPKEVANEMAQQHGLSVGFIYNHALRGFSARVPASRVEALKHNPQVAFINADEPISIPENEELLGKHSDVRFLAVKGGGQTPGGKGSKPTKTPTPTPLLTSTATPTPTPTTMTGQIISTGVSRIGRNTTNTGAGISVAILDSGIDLDHPDLQSRIIANYNCINPALTGDDDNGHGTHVAGIVGAANNDIDTVGVAPEVNLVSVKVLTAYAGGSTSSYICGIDWVTAHAQELNIKVVNMSLGTATGTNDNNCGFTDGSALHQALCNSTAQGITYVAAAGNNGNDSPFFPAAYDDTIIAVSALQDTDGLPGGLGGATDDIFWSSSNYGGFVDIGAPGVSIVSTRMGGGTQTRTGTSSSSPHVAAAAAMYLKNNPAATWNQVKEALILQAEPLNQGHTDPTGLHSEPIINTLGL